ncbi:ABC transporter permease [Patulibacter brassicae]|uniref:ABC transporter permease n=1 Tax=Patulibacter brassicae TaxID=1705717 RepID=A0ABU4VEB4_9ACTN|nr:ABC transporter permease [Patulibacter brassicae]MDX8150097.1 ABC transporter permease [Patulibacter brassicae]
MIAAPLAQAGEGFVRDRSGDAGSCVARDGVCPDWIADNLDRYVDPLLRHVLLTVVALAIGFAIAFALGLLAHRRRWLVAPIVQVTGILYTIPSLALFFLLLPLTGRGFLTAEIALVSYTLLIIFRNVIAGLDGVPADAVDAARGMGLTDREVLWRVELPLAVPEIAAGLRIAATTTVGLASLAFFAGAGGLGDPLYADLNFKSNVLVAGGLCVLLAIVLDLAVLAGQRVLTPWTRVAR